MLTVSLLDNFCVNLREAMEKNGFNQTALARRAGVRAATISDILRGEMEPSVELCEKIAKAANIRPDTAFLEPAQKVS
jgi:transcriptional regulator with XRE-family HTH domain